MLGYQPGTVLRQYMQRARAFIFAALEDFGIAPVEAQACGTPVIAFGKGGVTESVVDGKSGLFFQEQTADSLLGAIEQFERRMARFNATEIRANALRFSAERFKQQFRAYIEEQGKQPARVERAVG
jgi:glycosyltransferase involved in cell wall biosynthesis